MPSLFEYYLNTSSISSTCIVTLSSPTVSNGYTSKCSGAYWSNPPFFNFLTLGQSGAQC